MSVFDTFNKISTHLERHLQSLQAENAAHSALESFWDGYLPVDPVAIAARYGVRIFLRDSSEFSSPEIIASLRQMDSGPVILLNNGIKASTQRRAIAHALGHHILQGSVFLDETQGTLHARAEDHPLEFQASRFAETLLMPKEAIIFHYKSGSLPDFDAYIRQYVVPETMLADRFRSLGIID